MRKQTNLTQDVDDLIVVPEPVSLKRQQVNRYGSVPGLDDSELVDPDELERQIIRQEFEPLLTLPIRASYGTHSWDFNSIYRTDCGAFGSIDFDRYRSQPDKHRSKANRVKEKLKDVVILFYIVNNKLQPMAKYVVLKHLHKGIIELDHIVHEDMRALARLYLRIKKMRHQIAWLKEASERYRQRKAEALWGTW
ncbi:hypothetical protein ACFL6U_14495 [Planctomycetota bacterium]